MNRFSKVLDRYVGTVHLAQNRAYRPEFSLA